MQLLNIIMYFSLSNCLSSSLLSYSNSMRARCNFYSFAIFSISALTVLNSLYYSTLNLYNSVPTGILPSTRNKSTSSFARFASNRSSSSRSTVLTSFYNKNSYYGVKIENGFSPCSINPCILLLISDSV